NLAQQALEVGDVSLAAQLLEDHRPRPGMPDFRGWEWRYLWRQCQGRSLLTLQGNEGGIDALAISPDGRLLATGSTDATVRLWQTDTWRPLRILRGHKSYIWRVAFSPNGALLASTSKDGTLRLWDVRTGRPLAVLGGGTG